MTASRPSPLRLVAVPAAISLLALAACGSDDDSPAEAGATTDAPTATDSGSDSAPSDAAGGDVVTIAQSRFDPAELVVTAGTTVSFENTDSFDHTVTSRDDSAQSFDSGAFGADSDFTVTFDEPGTYAYFCQIHPTMRASIVVE